MPDVVQKYRVGHPKASPWVSAPCLLGEVPQFLQRESLGVALFVLTGTHLTPDSYPTTSGADAAEGEWGSLRRGTPLTLLLCPASLWARDRLAFDVEQVLVIHRTALHMSWTTRHVSRPTGKSWNVVPAAGEHNSWKTIKRHPATQLTHVPPRRPSRRSWNDDARGRHHSEHCQSCSKKGQHLMYMQPATARATTRRAPWPSPFGPLKGDQGR